MTKHEDGAALNGVALSDLLSVKPEEAIRCVVRLRTTVWADKNGLHTKKSLTFLRRRCGGFNLLEEDLSLAGAEDILTRIDNLNECEDGVYRVVTCNESLDYETGYVDDYDYRLVPDNDLIRGASHETK